MKEVDQNGNDYTPAGYEKTENGLNVINKVKKQSIPWTPLKPGKTVIPWAPLIPAKEVIPWTPLTPAKTVIPWKPLTPAATETVTPITPVTPTVQKTSVKVTKNWVGGQGNSAVVHLLADGKDAGTAELNAQNDWTYTFSNLDKESAGHDIQYTVTEDKVEGYTTSITGDMQNGYVITNTKEQPDKPVKPDKPDTPDTPVTPTPSKPDHHSGNNTPSHPQNTENKGGQNTPVKPASSTVYNHQTVKPMTQAAAKTAVSGNHAEASANIPKTGDETDLSLYAFLLGGAAALLAVILALKGHKEE
ncbi:MAG: Cna B-type domain-containing protein [Eubacterium sp.]